ncbi:DUF4238 domain-containing protein [Roseofilum sp. Belize Diploria]|uniref:DUF4238 domain-containing protein n=1 Tax=Roseofilum sp. Belize Diploria TaxID=2821501 RepID=UPI001B075DE7|nr:DUF4238 domain-containing protein [Roseofilum sp. Belize Diploria]MBP0010559.1 DUF4238 domain-containing protein [Roseofilum sp. Belize Diploria]
MGSTTNQHYVPRFYLKKFSNLSSGKYKIYLFDKFRVKENIHFSNIKNVATSNGFYDFPIESEKFFDDHNIHPETLSDIVNLSVGRKEFDRYLTKYEVKMQSIYNAFENRVSDILQSNNISQKNKIINKRDKQRWSQVLSTQYLRTPAFRKAIQEIKLKTDRWHEDQFFAERQASEILKIIIFNISIYYPHIPVSSLKLASEMSVITVLSMQHKLHNEQIALSHYGTFQKRVGDLSKILQRHKWSLGINQTDIPFYISDNPVARSPYSAGYGSEGVEILFPLNPKFILILRDKKHPKATEHDGKIVTLSTSEILAYNAAQVYCSERFVYCQKNEFELAKQICIENPEICSDAKDRVKIVYEIPKYD